MAFNMEKLQKVMDPVQGNPKQAAKECERRLKRHPNDPYLQMWRAELLAREHSFDSARKVLDSLSARQPPITDGGALAVIYHIIWTMKRQETVLIDSLGPPALGFWDRAAKTAPRRQVIELYSVLFDTAVYHGVWGDAQTALARLRREAPEELKYNFAWIVASHLSAQTLKASNSPATTWKMKDELAYRSLCKAMEQVNSKPGSKGSIATAREFRLLTQLFQRQGRYAELLSFLDSENPHIRAILDSNKIEFTRLRYDILQQNSNWKELWQRSYETLDQAVAGLEAKSEGEATNPEEYSKVFQVKDWKVWDCLLRSAEQLNDPEIFEKAKSLIDSYKNKGLLTREVGLANLRLSALDKSGEAASLLSHCNSYFGSHCKLASCFTDIKNFVESLDVESRRSFMEACNEVTQDIYPADSAEKAAWNGWIQAEINRLKLNYFLQISRLPKTEIYTASQKFLQGCVNVAKMGSQLKTSVANDAAVLAVVCLVKLSSSADSPSQACSYLLQAGFIMSDVLKGQEETDGRPLIATAIRLHLKLGLGSMGLQLYPYLRTKEVLHDTVSHIMFTHLSYLHPQRSAQTGFDPQDLLTRAVDMYSASLGKLHSYHGPRLKAFEYDQALEIQGLKEALDHSFAKHIFILERRRMARFRGQAILDEAIDDFVGMEEQLVDSRDYSIVLNFEPAQSQPFQELIASGPEPDKHWIALGAVIEQVWFSLDRQTVPLGFVPFAKGAAEKLSKSTAADELEEIWVSLYVLLSYIRAAETSAAAQAAEISKTEITTRLKSVLDAVKRVSSGIAPFSEPTFVTSHIPDASTLRTFFGSLDALRALWRFCETVRQLAKQKQLLPQQQRLSAFFAKNQIDELSASVEKTYGDIRALADRWKGYLGQQGSNPVLAMLSHGDTGALLMDQYGQEAVLGYATTCRRAYEESLDGLLGVRLK